jgi:hypothetical protein
MARGRFGPWYVLGLDPTHDERAIKRAYAAKLKALDVDANRQGFLDLRTAFDSARREAQWIKPPVEEEKQVAPPSLADPSLDFRPENLRAAPSGRMLRNKPVEPREKIRVTAASKTEAEKPKKERLKGKTVKPPELVETQPTKPRVTKKATSPEFLTEDAAPKVRVTFGKSDESADEPAFHPKAASPWEEVEADGTALDACLSRLSRLIRRNKGQPVHEAAVEATFLKMLEAPELDNVGRREMVETQIAEMVIRAKDRGHYLLLLANWHFGWHQRADDFDLRWPMNEIAELAPAIQKYRRLQGIGQGVENDLDAFRWLQQPPPSRLSPLYWWRRSSVLGLVNRSREKMPRLLDLIGRDNIAAWESVAFSGWRLIIMAAVLLYGATQWSLQLVLAPDLKGAPQWLFGLLAFIVIATAVLLAERAETRRLENDPSRFHDLPKPTSFAALGALAVLTLLCGLLPPSPWVVLASLPATMGLFYLNQISLLREPSRERSFLYERRYTMGAFLIMVGLSRYTAPLQFAAAITPSLFLCWTAARLHEPLQLWLDQQRKLRRWHLQLPIWFMAEACLLACLFIAPGIAIREVNTPVFLLHFAAFLIVVCHDLITPRSAEIPGTSFLILPIMTAFATLLFPIQVMMGVIILRCVMIFVAAWRSRKRAAETGRVWRDSGVGYNSGTDFSNITFFGLGGRKEEGSGISGWTIFFIIFFGFQLLRLLL